MRNFLLDDSTQNGVQTLSNNRTEENKNRVLKKETGEEAEIFEFSIWMF